MFDCKGDPTTWEQIGEGFFCIKFEWVDGVSNNPTAAMSLDRDYNNYKHMVKIN